MNIGDIILIDSIEFIIWFIEDGIYHIKDALNNGHCGDLFWLLAIKD